LRGFDDLHLTHPAIYLDQTYYSPIFLIDKQVTRISVLQMRNIHIKEKPRSNLSV